MRNFIFLFFPLMLFSQSDSLRFAKPSKSDGIIIAYQISGEPKDRPENEKLKTLHSVGFYYSKIFDGGGRHPNSGTYYVGSDFIFNYNRFLLSPKLGVDFCANAMCLGAELNFYTDLSKLSPRISPYFGIGGNGFKIYLGYTVKFYHVQDFPPNTLNVGLTFPIYNFASKRFLFKK